MSPQRKDTDGIQPDACWKVLERAAASTQLKRAARSREFLFYVAGKSLKDGFTEVHEQEIGHAVFGRDADYDTSQDNIVRVSATDLRKRIDGYFAAEGADEPLIFEIPRGSYVPVFRARRPEPEPDPVAVEEEAETPLPAAAPTPQRRLPLMLVSALALVLAIACGVLWKENQNLRRVPDRWEGKPALGAFWSRFLNSPRETDMVLSDTSFALVEDITRQYFSLTEYLNQTYLHEIQASKLSADRKADIDMISVRSNGSLGDFRVTQRIQALDPASPKLVTEYAREYTADSIKRNNVILIGSQKPNPWVDLFYNQLTFTIEYDPKLDQSSVINHSPRAGEQAVYPIIPKPDSTVGYSIIAYLPNPSHTSDVLIIAGSNSQATDAAGEFLTSEPSMENFLKKLPSKQIPYFEILLKTTRLNGTPFAAELVTYRTY